MKKKFVAIAMKCNQEQFNLIKDKLEGKIEFYSVSAKEFEKYDYLVNCDFGRLSNVNKLDFKHIWRQSPEIHETWNEKIFLEACGIETIPTLEEVKEYFKNAEKVQCIFDKGLISEIDVNKIKFKYGEYWCEIIDSEINLWDTTKGYAKILTYKKPKEETFVISMEQIDCLCDKNEAIQGLMREWFPSAFVEDKKELGLEVGKWYKYPNYQKFNLCITEVDKKTKTVKGYGFGVDGLWMDDAKNDIWHFQELELCIEMTQQEVEEALKAEAVRRYKVGDIVLINDNKHKLSGLDTFGGFCHFYNNIIWINEHESSNVRVFENGKWAEIIQPKKMTQAEIEKELGYLIEIV